MSDLGVAEESQASKGLIILMIIFLVPISIASIAIYIRRQSRKKLELENRNTLDLEA